MTYVWTVEYMDYDAYGAEAVVASPAVAWRWLAEKYPDHEMTANFDVDNPPESCWDDDSDAELPVITVVPPPTTSRYPPSAMVYGLVRHEVLEDLS